MQNTEQQRFLVVGRVGSAYGVRGWLNVTSYTDPPENLLSYNPLFLKITQQQQSIISAEQTAVKNQGMKKARITETVGEWQAMEVTEGRPHGNSLVLKFALCNDRDCARILTGTEIAIIQTQLPPLSTGEYYWVDLIGLTVITTENQVLGTLEQFIATGANDVFVVSGEKRRLLPYLPSVVKSIDLEQKIMQVDWDPEF